MHSYAVQIRQNVWLPPRHVRRAEVLVTTVNQDALRFFHFRPISVRKWKRALHGSSDTFELAAAISASSGAGQEGVEVFIGSKVSSNALIS